MQKREGKKKKRNNWALENLFEKTLNNNNNNNKKRQSNKALSGFLSPPSILRNGASQNVCDRREPKQVSYGADAGRQRGHKPSDHDNAQLHVWEGKWKGDLNKENLLQQHGVGHNDANNEAYNTR